MNKSEVSQVGKNDSLLSHHHYLSAIPIVDITEAKCQVSIRVNLKLINNHYSGYANTNTNTHIYIYNLIKL